MRRCDGRFVWGFALGIVITFLFIETRNHYSPRILETQISTDFAEEPNDDSESHLNDPQLVFDQPQKHAQHGQQHSHAKNAISDTLFNKVKILCWIMTHPTEKNIKKVTSVNETWAQRCNKVVYFSTYKNLGLETEDLEFQEGRNFLWDKTKRVLLHLHKKYGDQFDWYFKADDDTFAVMENMRFMLSAYDPAEPRYIGCNFKLNNIFYNSGGAGYVMSRAAMAKFADNYSKDRRCPPGTGGPEDYNLGRCMNAFGINATDSRDLQGRLRFLPLSAQSHFGDHLPSWLERYVVHEYHHKAACCSDLVITFHYITPDVMYLLEFFTYHLHVFGRENDYSIPSTVPKEGLYGEIQKISRSFGQT
ncbi:unnamed protein product, partial [Mesorhabditis spiculigera]